MELVLKLPQGKPPFIGILFEKEYEGARLNQHCVNEHKHAEYQIIMESNSPNINLTLITKDFNFKHKYENVKCDWPKLMIWLSNLKPGCTYNFSHVVREYDKDSVVKTLERHKLFVLKISKIQIYD